jgi:peptide-methionine (R)-S-oxide reductase
VRELKYEVYKTDEQWKSELSEFEYHVLRMAGTERAYTGELLEESRPGCYHCRGCDAFLFEAIEYIEDRSHGMIRTEVRCAKCGSHLGHVFDDAPQTPTGDRYCINSVSITFKPKQ